MSHVRAQITAVQAHLERVVAYLYELGAPPATSTSPTAVYWGESFAMACIDGRVWLCTADGTEFHIGPHTTLELAKNFVLAIRRNNKEKESKHGTSHRIRTPQRLDPGEDGRENALHPLSGDQ